MANYDCVIVGAGTAGLYFARELAGRGFSVLVIEKSRREDTAKRLDIIHFPEHMYANFDIPAPVPGDGELERIFTHTYTRSALDTYEKVNENHIYAAHLPVFNRRLADMAEAAGAEIIYGAEYLCPVFNAAGDIRGIVYRRDGEEISVNAVLVADASGIDSRVRRDLRSEYMETFEIGPMDRFYVTLKYVVYDEPSNETRACLSWPWFKCWIGPCSLPGGGIIGCGASSSFKYCRYMMEKFEKAIPRPAYSGNHFEYGSTPYMRTPYSFVAPGFIALGDSACLTNPMSGEGVDYQLDFIKQTLPVIVSALEEKDCSAEALWPVNVIYNRGTNAEVQNTRASVSCIMRMNEKENEFLFEKGLIFHSDGEPEPDMASELIKGTLKGRIRPGVFFGTVGGVLKAGRIKNHYRAFPDSPSGYADWVKKADLLWRKAGKITDFDEPMPE